MMAFANDPLGHLPTEARHPRSATIDLLDATQIATLMNEEDATIAPMIAAQTAKIGALVTAIVHRLNQGGRLIYVGAGTSGRLGVLDASECPPTFNSPPGQILGIIAGGQGALQSAVEGAEDSFENALEELESLALDSRDCLVAIAASGRTPYCLGALAKATAVGALTGVVVCVKQSEMARQAQHAIEVETGPEILTGSTRLRAGTATKLILNTLSTAVMIGLGKTHGNLLVDLHATNEKLTYRAIRIVSQAANISLEDAKLCLAQCQGEVKTAIVLSLLQTDPATARRLLLASGGRISRAFHQPQITTKPSEKPKVLVAIDGGATTLKLRFATTTADGLVHSPTQMGPPVLPGTHGVAGVVFEWKRRILGFLAKNGANPDAVTAIVAGTSGAGTSEICGDLRSLLAIDFPNASIEVMSDVRLLAYGAGDPTALCLIAGTGSIAWWEPNPGTVHRMGGWGPLIGDEGGGIWLVHQAIKAICWAEEGRANPSSLKELFLCKLGLVQVRNLVLWLSKATRPQLAPLAKLVFQAAALGDPVAKDLLLQGANHLVALVTALKKRNEDPTLVLAAGGTLENQEYWDLFQAKLTVHYPDLILRHISDPLSDVLLMVYAKTDQETFLPHPLLT